VPPSTVVTPIRLYPLYCTLYFCTLTCWQLAAQVPLSFAFVSDIFVPFLQCALHWLQLSKRFLLRFRLEVYSFSFFCWELAVATTALNFEHICFLLRIFFVYYCLLSLRSFSCCTRFSTLGRHPNPRSFLVSDF
jgi:hypothetical protein